jgi:hypothetical protein
MVLSGYAFARIDGVSTGVDIANLWNCHGDALVSVAACVVMSAEKVRISLLRTDLVGSKVQEYNPQA